MPNDYGSYATWSGCGCHAILNGFHFDAIWISIDCHFGAIRIDESWTGCYFHATVIGLHFHATSNGSSSKSNDFYFRS
jgi:hypothetical protein